jgi:hypothetical protein
MHLARIAFFLVLLCVGNVSMGQRIVYSDPDKDDSRKMNFEIIGKVSGNFLIYKNNHGKNYIASYNNEMEEIGKEELDYIPDDRLINVDFFPYGDFSYMVY